MKLINHSTEELRQFHQWNDSNGDYENLNREELLEVAEDIYVDDFAEFANDYRLFIQATV